MAERSFSPEKRHCHYRLPVAYDPKAVWPENWLRFLHELLDAEDVLTLQEFFGYCLLPMNQAQKMLVIIGEGGEGKSRIGIVARALFGDAMANGSLAKLENSPFARADLEHRLLMVDDDLQLSALRTTGNIKTLITAEQPLDLERKGKQSYQGRMYCRLMAFGNGNLQALHDRSRGFFRRQIILTALPKRPDREDDPFLGVMMGRQAEGILAWALAGLDRLMENEFCFTLSPRARENLRSSAAEGNNVMDFVESAGYLRSDPRGCITSRRLYEIYLEWCEDNGLQPLPRKLVSNFLVSAGDRYGITYSTHIPVGNGRMVRGFYGIRAVV